MNMTEQNIIAPVDEDVPTKINETSAKLVSKLYKHHVVLLLSVIFNVMQGYWINSANERAEMNTEMFFLKMYPNGSWDVEYRNTGSEADFFPLTIDKLLMDYVDARYAVVPGMMRRNYGVAVVFMSPTLQSWFVGAGDGQFNAPKIASELNKSITSEEIKIRFVDHFDVSNGVFVQGNSDIYRTNVFIERTVKNALGQVQGAPVKEVINLQWRIKSVKELKKLSRDELRVNPIGLEIIKDDKVLDISDTK